MTYLQVDGLYLMMGRGLDRLQQVPAGNVVAIGGLGTAILKSATITSSLACRPLAPMLFQVTCCTTQNHAALHCNCWNKFLTPLELSNKAKEVERDHKHVHVV